MTIFMWHEEGKETLKDETKCVLKRKGRKQLQFISSILHDGTLKNK